jgi:hypothetical protein
MINLTLIVLILIYKLRGVFIKEYTLLLKK